jgi:hypothetical protein
VNCPACGKQTDRTSGFCTRCGARLTETPARAKFPGDTLAPRAADQGRARPWLIPVIVVGVVVIAGAAFAGAYLPREGATETTTQVTATTAQAPVETTTVAAATTSSTAPTTTASRAPTTTMRPKQSTTTSQLTTTTTQMPTTTSAAYTVTIPGTSEAGVAVFAVRAGTVIHVRASGTWGSGGIKQDGTASRGDPGGIRPADPGETDDLMLLGYPIGLLIGRVGAWLFPIGASADLACQQDGTLWLLMNDRKGFYGDNDGSVTATVWVTDG